MNWIDNTLAIDSQMLLLRARRAEVISANLANADTPGFKARELNFASVLNEAERMTRTSDGHFSPDAASVSVDFRAHGKVSANGNNVEREYEQAAFTRNSVEYLANLRFLDRSTQGLLGALRGD